MRIGLVSVVALALVIGAVALPPIAYRLDDIQCSDATRVSAVPIIAAFQRNQVPLTLAVITGGPGRPVGCYMDWVPAAIAGSNNSMIEIGSHTFSHNNLVTTADVDYDLELRQSRETLIGQFPTRPINLLVPPNNAFNRTIATASAAAGYTVMSPQCTTRQMSTGGAQPLDTLCPVNVYSTLAPFFVDPSTVGGLYYVPVGASIVKFGNVGTLLNETELLNAPLSDCDNGTIGICSAAQQIEAMSTPVNRLANGAQAFSVIMVHPQDMSNNGLNDAAAIGAYWDRVLAASKLQFDHYTISGLLALNGINVPNTTTITTTSSSTGMSTSTGMSGVSGASGVSGSTGSSASGRVSAAPATAAAGLSAIVAIVAAVAALL